MTALSVVIITFNEQHNITRCLKSVNWADEIVVVDSGSTDKTKDICLNFNCKLFDSPWLGFGQTKRLAVSKASNDWILSIDADEELTEKAAAEIIDLLKSKPPFKGYRIKRESFYLGKKIKYCGWNKDYTLRLFNRNYGNFNDKVVHEFVEINGAIGLLKNTMLHYTYPDLKTHINKMKRYAQLGAEQLLDKGKTSNPIGALMRGVFKFKKMYFLQLGFLDGTNGFLLCFNSAWGVYLKYILLWERLKNSRKS